MNLATDIVFGTDALLLEILCYLDAASLGRVDQVASLFREVAFRAWIVHSQRIYGHLSMARDAPAFDYKEQVRRYCLARTFSSNMTREHRRHFLQTTFYIPPRSEPEVAPNCSYCTSLPNLRTSTLLTKNVESYAYFVQLSTLNRHDGESAMPKTILEDFLPVQDIDMSQKYARLRLSLRESFDPKKWPSCSYFLEQCRMQAPSDVEHIWFPTFSKQLLAKLEVTVTAINRNTSQPSLIVATGGGTTTVNDLRQWTMFRRLADTHPTPTALRFGVIPTLETRIIFSPDYSTLDALEISVI